MDAQRELEGRIKKLEDTVVALETAIQLLTVSHKPTSDWLDKTMEKIRNA